MADFSDLNPEFASRLAKFRAALTQAGIQNNLVSGYRTPEYQNQMYQNRLAKVAGQSLPYPGVEAPAVVAPPWRSFHNYGIAADFQLGRDEDYARLQSMAPQYGLSGIGMSDKGHIQLAGNLDQDIAKYSLANWRPAGQPAPASGAIAYGGPSPPATPTPGTSLNSSPLDIVLQAESGDRNINNVHQGTSSGQAQGNVQITTGTWTDFAPKAGIDLKQYPTPDSAPRSVQIAVASQIPLNRWANSTVQAVLAKYPGIDTSQTLGSIQSAALAGPGGSGSPASAPPAAAGAPAPAGAAGAPGGLPGFQAGSAAEKMTQSGLKQLTGGGGGDVRPMQLQPAMGGQAVGGPMMLGAGGQNVPGRSAQLAQSNLSQLSALAQANSVQPVAMPGTTLNSMALQAGLFKSPYDTYANPDYYRAGSA